MNVPTEPHHGIPALLSFFVPGLGQLVKKQVGLALTIWILIAVSALVATLGFSMATSDRMTWHPALDIVLLVASVVLYLFSAGVWVWGIVDAYNRPA